MGGGPVGLLLALLLDRHGVRSVVFNAELGVREQPRGSTHNARTMEHYRRLGLSGQVRRLGLPWDHPTGISFFTRYAGFELCRLPHPPEAELLRATEEAPCTDQVPEPQHRANQMYVERLLLETAATRPGITLRFGRAVRAIRQNAAGVTIHSEPAGVRGEPEVTRAAYAVGCDGGRSLVRRTLGIGYAGAGSIDQDILGRTAIAAHLRVPELYTELLGHRRAWSYWAINNELALNLIALDGRDQFFLLTSSVDAATVDASVLANLVRRAIGADHRVEVLDYRPWTPGAALVAERFGAGRVLLAGDAVHLFTPNGGFGMNTGMDDAANLAWKLAAAVHGWAGPGLVASYETERRPIALRNTAAARELNVGLGAIGRPAALEEDSPAGAEARRRVGQQLADYGLRTLDTLGVQLGARYDESPIVAADPADVPPVDRFHEYHPSGVPGGRTPHVWLSDAHHGRRSLYDLLGSNFTVLRLGGRAEDAGPLCGAAARLGVPVTVLDVPLDAARELYGRDLALVRPDQHLAWRGNRIPDDPEALLRTVSGGLGHTTRCARWLWP
ncbi:FAD-dependent monooxygenase, partial [Actinophytocola sp.]|uniref:FAD-dependent monooxygenase n=1 Tax=Actinophytocola sp. TaxID=1872138 RepID=UPI003C757417